MVPVWHGRTVIILDGFGLRPALLLIGTADGGIGIQRITFQRIKLIQMLRTGMNHPKQVIRPVEADQPVSAGNIVPWRKALVNGVANTITDRRWTMGRNR